jgi:hypothetical protein
LCSQERRWTRLGRFGGLASDAIGTNRTPADGTDIFVRTHNKGWWQPFAAIRVAARCKPASGTKSASEHAPRLKRAPVIISNELSFYLVVLVYSVATLLIVAG